MQIVRTVAWVVLLVALLTFSFFNWKPVEVQIWANLILETKVPALVIVSFLLGLVPMWLIHRSAQWRHRRRVTALETAARSQAATSAAAAAAAAPPPTAIDETPAPPLRPVTDETLPPTPSPAIDETPQTTPAREQPPKPKDEILG